MTAREKSDPSSLGGEAKWRAIVQSAVDGIIVIDRRGTIESFNPAAERLFEYRAEEIVGQNVSMLMPPPFADEHDHYIERYLATRLPKIIGIGREVTGRRKNGTVFPLHLSVGETSIEGETKFIGIVRDLTDRVAMELKLREESALARIGELAAVLAHEVRNPLAAVSGAIQMIAPQLPEDSEAHEIIDEILRRLDALSQLMGDLLLYAKPPLPNFEDVDVSALLESVVAFFQTDPAWRTLRVTQSGGVPAVRADPELLRIAIQNLLLNAAQAMHGDGTLTVRLHHSETTAYLDVTDSGPGIPAEVRTQVFRPFFTTKAAGTGLGLATVKRIAESHAGDIAILDSSPVGTTMRLTLPLGHRGVGNWTGS